MTFVINSARMSTASVFDVIEARDHVVNQTLAAAALDHSMLRDMLGKDF